MFHQFPEIKNFADFEQQWDSTLERITQESALPFDEEGVYWNKKIRLLLSRHSLLKFAHIYLPSYVGKTYATFHRKWERIAQITGAPVLIEAFPEAGKSTFFSFIDILHAICFGRAHYILLGAFTADRAKIFTGRILAELLANRKLHADFGKLVEKNSFALFKAKDTTVQAISIGHDVCGLVAGLYRPDFVRFDDIQSRESAHKHKMVEEQVRWITMDLIPILSENYNFKIVATQMASRDVVQLLREGSPKRKAFKRVRTPLFNKVGESIWPQQYKPKRIAGLQKTLGRRGFTQKYLLQIIEDEETWKNERK